MSAQRVRVLREVELVSAEPAGRYTYYQLRPDRLRGLAAHLTMLAALAEDSREERRPCP